MEDQRMLGQGPPYTLSFAWSPDGDAIAYLTEDAVWIARLAGGAPELYWRSTPTPDYEPGGLILPGAPQELWWLSTGDLAVAVASADVSKNYPYLPEGPNVLHIIDDSSGHHQKIELADSSIVWSPDDSRFAFVGEAQAASWSTT